MVLRTNISVGSLAALVILLYSCHSNSSAPTPVTTLQLTAVRAGTVSLNLTAISTDIPGDQPIVADFSASLDTTSVKTGLSLLKDGAAVPFKLSWLNDFKTFSLLPQQPLTSLQKYTLSIGSSVTGKKGEAFKGSDVVFVTAATVLKIVSMKIGTQVVTAGTPVTNVPLTNLTLEVNFSAALDPASVTSTFVQVLGPPAYASTLNLLDGNKKLTITLTQALPGFTRCRLYLSDQLKGQAGDVFTQTIQEFFTAIDPTPKFPVISDDALLTLVQQQTFKYFWDFAHPVSGLARERNTSGNIVTIGGSGFGIMSIPIAIQRNFITRSDGIARLNKIIPFLEAADRFHGAWPHWMDGNTGKVIPFSPDDDGGDLVETSFMIQGLLTVRQFLNPADPTENTLIQKINGLWKAVEFDWYTQGQNVLYWHWSPRVAWKMNFAVHGWNEALIMYFLAAASPAHSINPAVYQQGWARSGGMKNGKTFYNTVLPLGEDYGGPLFFAHYSFLGLNPNNLSDAYANYWTQNVSHATINYRYCVANPLKKIGYSEQCWGLTASDNDNGYSAHSPTNDLGVIAPTAALSSFPYTPVESMKALKFFYYSIGDRLWGPAGFYDAFNPGTGWYATSTLAIDQGPIIIMIENYRTGSPWNLFMSAPEAQAAMTKLNFTN